MNGETRPNLDAFLRIYSSTFISTFANDAIRNIIEHNSVHAEEVAGLAILHSDEAGT